MRRILFLIATLLSLSVIPQVAYSFCGFYVAKADAKIFNKVSQVVLVRHEDKTVITMANDFKGDLKEFAVVIPVPTFIEKDQIHIGDQRIIDHLDAYTSPRLVEYFDGNPCQIRYGRRDMELLSESNVQKATQLRDKKSPGVTVEATYTVGEYDIVILSAKQSGALEIWLKQNGYRIPKGAANVLKSYIKQKMRFFIAKVNLEEQSKLGFAHLRPIQVAYESPKFMLPIRLGTINANGPQELFIYTLTKKGRVETTNYRTVKLPTGMDLPVYVKGKFAEFYRSMFRQQVRKEDMRAVFLEYAWNMSWCDPCAANPLSVKELRDLGVFWLHKQTSNRGLKSQARDAFVTRMHVRYDAEHFPEDLIFQETADRSNFQGRYVLRHPWAGKAECGAAKQYRTNLWRRQEKEAQNLASLTGWDINKIRTEIGISGSGPKEGDDKKPWWQRIWVR
ncbi:MAG: DUF2330 domain-containing protein [Candidatus Binatia bacterium]